MAGNPTGSRIRIAVVVLLAVLFAWPAGAGADDERTVTVPDVRRRRVEDARRVLEAAGLKVGEVYEFSTERILRMFKVRGVLGTVFLQKPTPGTGWKSNKPVDLVVVAAKDGKLPPNMPGARKPAGKAVPPKAAPPKDAAKQPAVPPNGHDAAGDPIPPLTPPADDTPRPATPKHASGSPDAPRAAPKPSPDRVPDLVGLELAEAEMLVRQSKMTLHVERTAGHPVGRVLEQVPAGGTKRPAGGAIKVVITAGGDYESRMPGPPAVYLNELVLPSLLDRTKLQAERIVESLGLKLEWNLAKRGLAGRVVDQKPAAGEKIAKGGVLRLWVGPDAEGDTPAKGDKPLPPGPLGDKPAKGTPAKDAAKKKKSGETKPLDPGTLKAGIPKPVSPGVNTPIPVGAKVPVGFTWRGVTGANAYIVEIEEQGAEGRWMPLARKPARTTAVLMDVERLDPKGESRLRWRVTAVVAGRHGTPSKWVVLK